MEKTCLQDYPENLKNMFPLYYMHSDVFSGSIDHTIVCHPSQQKKNNLMEISQKPSNNTKSNNSNNNNNTKNNRKYEDKNRKQNVVQLRNMS